MIGRTLSWIPSLELKQNTPEVSFLKRHASSVAKQGDWFYVVDEGEYVVTLEQGGKDVEILKYTTHGGANPCALSILELLARSRHILDAG